MIYFAIIETITNILGSIDKKIEINKKKIEKLEAIAREIYDYWFVQYEFPDENGKPYKSSGGAMKNANGMIIPQSYELKTLNDILLLLKDGTHNPPLRAEKGIPLLTGTMFGNVFLEYKDVTYIKVEDYNSIHSKYEPQYGDCILTKIGTLGTANVLRKRDIPIAIHCNSALLRFCPEYNGSYSICLLKSKYFQKKLKASKGQSVQEFISLDSLSKIQIVVPQTSHIRLFNKVCNQLFEEMELLSYELEKLKEKRNIILPLLMNGQVKVI